MAWPLTGLDATTASAADLAHPALSIKIENSAAAKPQTNLQYADVVFEEYVEAGISRLIAIYQSDYPKEVGPIRSMRPMDRNIMGSFKGPLIFSGAQRRFINTAAASGQKLIAQDVGSPGFFRTTDKPAPHNLHGTLASFLKQAAGMPAPKPQWPFAYPADQSTAQLSGTPATHLDIYMSPYAQPDWKWNAARQLWLRYEGKTPHTTADGTQLSATNVVMIWVSVQYTSGGPHASVPETLVAGRSGGGFIASGDKTIPIKWSKKGQYDPFVFTTADGAPVVFAAGQTWIELVPNKGVSNRTSIVIS